ncbi:MAG: hypothetical protein JWO96_798 [Candidatus Saccharibacteria bacterium]|nr:hypothetical protein [Candidatus Saccharibacteria bacterium]
MLYLDDMRLTRRLVGIAATALVLLGLVAAVARAQSIEDWFRLRGYQPPAQIAAIATEDSLTPYGRHVLYVTHPKLDGDSASFLRDCSQAEQTIVLGCYHSGASLLSSDSFLFVKDVKDPRLQGVRQVTAAHEMLHAAYDRLSGNEKKTIDAQLQAFYDNGVHDQRLIDTINAYKKTEPADVVNEMHSIFGTEVANLPAPLENYYKKYFVNRGAVVAFASSYEGEFTSRTAQIKADDAQLAQLKQQIGAQEQQLQSQLSGIDGDRARVEQSNDSASINQYNSRVTSYNAGVRKLQSDIAAYNALVEARNAIATELRSLQGSLDSRLTAQPAQ